MITAHVVSTAVHGTPEWHEARRSGVGGSDIAAILGLSPFESLFSLWHRKAGIVGPQADKPEMEWGRRLEPVLREKFNDAHPELKAIAPGVTYANDDDPWRIGNFDGLVYPAGWDGTSDPVALWEGKCAYNSDAWGEPGTDEIPINYRCQVLWYLSLLGLRRAYVSVLVSGCDYREYVVDIDPDDTDTAAEIRLMHERAREFLDSLPTDTGPGVRPDIDESSHTYTVIKQLPDGVDDEPVTLPRPVADAYREACAEYATWKGRKTLAASQVLDHLGNAKWAYDPDGDPVATRAVKTDGTTHSLRPAKEPTNV